MEPDQQAGDASRPHNKAGARQAAGQVRERASEGGAAPERARGNPPPDAADLRPADDAGPGGGALSPARTMSGASSADSAGAVAVAVVPAPHPLGRAKPAAGEAGGACAPEASLPPLPAARADALQARPRGNALCAPAQPSNGGACGLAAAAAAAPPPRLYLSNQHPAVLAALAAPPLPSPPPRPPSWAVRSYLLMPLVLPLLAAWYAAALLAALLAALAVVPSLLLARHLYWACPFIPHVWRVRAPQPRRPCTADSPCNTPRGQACGGCCSLDCTEAWRQHAQCAAASPGARSSFTASAALPTRAGARPAPGRGPCAAASAPRARCFAACSLRARTAPRWSAGC